MATTEMVRPTNQAADTSAAAASTVKTILVHLQDAASADQRIETALSIARAASAHLTCLQVTPIEAYVAFEGFGGVFVMNDVMKAIDDEAERLRREIEEKLRNEDVSWDCVQLTGSVATEIARHGALADLIVTGREPRKIEYAGSSISLLGDLLQFSRTPMFIPGSAPFDPTGPAIVAWNGSFEAANAVRGTLGLLKLASNVRVLHVTQSREKVGSFPGTQLLEYLSRHGIHAELVVESLVAANDDIVATGLVSHSASMGGAYLVMGGYSHSRIREFLFGGVTRTMLSEASVPLVIAH